MRWREFWSCQFPPFMFGSACSIASFISGMSTNNPSHYYLCCQNAQPKFTTSIWLSFFGTFMHPRLLTSMRGNMQVEYSGRGFAFWGPGILQRLVECKDSWRGKEEFIFLHFLAENLTIYQTWRTWWLKRRLGGEQGVLNNFYLATSNTGWRGVVCVEYPWICDL